MGANCCVAAKDKRQHNSALLEVATYRNIRHSPSWSFRCDNRTHIEDLINNQAIASHGINSGNAASEVRSEMTTETEGLSNRASPSNDLQTQKSQKSPVKNDNSAMLKTDLTEQLIESNSSLEASKSSCPESVSDAKLSISLPPNPSFSATRTDPSSSRSQALPSEPTSSRKARRSPGFQLSRQISDSRIPSLKSFNESNSPEGRQPCMLSVCSTDFSAGGSHDGSSDGWSMHTFTELVASSRRERWSFDSENLVYNNCRSVKSDSQQLMPESPDQQPCRICTKQLKEKSPWSAQKIVASNELSVIAVLVCGHVYHAECLENMTHGSDSYDPPCPICTHGEKSVAKRFGKVERARSKISRIAVADVDTNQVSFSDEQKTRGKVPRMGASSSMKSSLGRPFLKRHFSVGRPSRSLSLPEGEPSRKKSFWERYWRA